MTQNPNAFKMPRTGIVRTAIVGLGVAALVLTTTGCGVSRVLRADFNEYTGEPSGEDLNGPIPGVPDGDAIENAGDVSVGVDQGFIEGKSLEIQGSVDFVPASHETPDEYQIDWLGFRTFIGQSGTSTMTFLDDDGEVALELVFSGEDGNLHLTTGTEFVPSVMLGSLPHDIDITIDFSIKRMNFSYQEVNEEVPHELNGLDFLDSGFDGLDRIRFEGPSNATYFLNDLDVFAVMDQ